MQKVCKKVKKNKLNQFLGKQDGILGFEYQDPRLCGDLEWDVSVFSIRAGYGLAFQQAKCF